MQTKTVFILGAGASASYGLPTGGELAVQVAEAVREIGQEKVRCVVQSRTFVNPKVARHQFAEPANRLADAIRRSRTETIDAYIAAQPEEIADQITQGMIDVLWKLEGEKASTNEPPREGDWIAWLYHNRLKKRLEDFKENNVVFVSFNYDRLPRFIFATMMANLYAQPVNDCWNGVETSFKLGTFPFPRFIHPHGRIRSDPAPVRKDRTLDTRYSRNALESASEGIRVMGDKDNDDPINYAAVWQWADRIYFLGFGYHQELMDRIGLTRAKIAERISCRTRVGGTGFNLTPLQREAVRARVGEDFSLGPPEQDCLTFLQHELRDEEMPSS